jgi:hypothetical protein
MIDTAPSFAPKRDPIETESVPIPCLWHANVFSGAFIKNSFASLAISSQEEVRPLFCCQKKRPWVMPEE